MECQKPVSPGLPPQGELLKFIFEVGIAIHQGVFQSAFSKASPGICTQAEMHFWALASQNVVILAEVAAGGYHTLVCMGTNLIDHTQGSAILQEGCNGSAIFIFIRCTDPCFWGQAFGVQTSSQCLQCKTITAFRTFIESSHGRSSKTSSESVKPVKVTQQKSKQA